MVPAPSAINVYGGAVEPQPDPVPLQSDHCSGAPEWSNPRRPYVDVSRVKCPLEVIRSEWILIMDDGPCVAFGQPIELRRCVVELKRDE